MIYAMVTSKKRGLKRHGNERILGELMPACNPRQVRECPLVSIIPDHCGVPAVKGCVLDPWREHMRLIAANENVTCKISGLVVYANPVKHDSQGGP